MSNKETVFADLKALGVNHVMVDYDGSGDSGQVNDVVAYKSTADTADQTNANGTMHQNAVIRAMTRLLTEDEVVLNQELNTRIKDLCWDYLESTFPGWEINDGASGNFTLDVESGRIQLTHSAYFIGSETTEHEF